MKQFTILSILAISLLFISCGHQDKSKVVETKVGKEISKIEVIDFYGTHRCVTCKAIEASAKYTVETYFANEPKVVFKTVNVDDDANYKIAESFEATGTALFLNVIKDGKETHINLTDFGFSKGREQETFSKELKVKIENELKKL
ncbi:MAG: nitrophenyl compound nitroreductase subunit ArsF family protein [Flavobacteriales bacterium]